jgi:hypothetical protein
VNLLTDVLSMLQMILNNTESDCFLSGFIERRIIGASYDINQY